MSMSKSPSNIRQADVKRCLKALITAGAAVRRVVIEGSKIEFIFDGADGGSAETEPLDKWMAAHADSTKGH
jgi:hypothetical protein